MGGVWLQASDSNASAMHKSAACSGLSHDDEDDDNDYDEPCVSENKHNMSTYLAPLIWNIYSAPEQESQLCSF